MMPASPMAYAKSAIPNYTSAPSAPVARPMAANAPVASEGFVRSQQQAPALPVAPANNPFQVQAKPMVAKKPEFGFIDGGIVSGPLFAAACCCCCCCALPLLALLIPLAM